MVIPIQISLTITRTEGTLWKSYIKLWRLAFFIRDGIKKKLLRKNCRVFTKRVSSLRLAEQGKTQLWLSQRAATANLSGQEGKQHCSCKELSLEERLENVEKQPHNGKYQSTENKWKTVSNSLEKKIIRKVSFILSKISSVKQSGIALQVSLRNDQGLTDLELWEWIHVLQIQVLEGLGKGSTWISIQQVLPSLSGFFFFICSLSDYKNKLKTRLKGNLGVHGCTVHWMEQVTALKQGQSHLWWHSCLSSCCLWQGWVVTEKNWKSEIGSTNQLATTLTRIKQRSCCRSTYWWQMMLYWGSLNMWHIPKHRA